MKTLCTICMRGSSKGILNKNLKRLNGVPIMKYTIDQAFKCKIFQNRVNFEGF